MTETAEPTTAPAENPAPAKPGNRLVAMTGKRFGRLVVIRRQGSTNDRKATWRCRCDCGRETTASGKDIRSGNTSSCGCVQTENRFTHGRSRERIYRIWQAMMQRCGNPKNSHWRWYGGRGIKVCEAWQDPEVFIRDMHPTYRDGLTLDRYPNNDGDYEPGNCRWATSEQQHLTQRRRTKSNG